MKLLDLPFKCRYEIAKTLLKDNPDKLKEIIEWVISFNGEKTQ